MAKHYEVVLRIGTVHPSREYKRTMRVMADNDVSFSLLLDQWHRGNQPAREDEGRVKVRFPIVAYSARCLIIDVESATSPDGRNVKAIAREALE